MTDPRAIPNASPATPSDRDARRATRCALITHGDVTRTRAAIGRVVDVARRLGVEITVPDDEVHKHAVLRDVATVTGGEDPPVDIVLSLGGDGTILRALHRWMASGTPVIGVNFGRVGFLTSIGADEIEERLPEVLAGTYAVLRLPTVEVQLHGERHVAINDVIVTSAVQGRMAVLDWQVNGVDMGERGCDGIVVATPSGSTAYNLSAGGPVLGWGVDAMVATFIAPHALDARPLVLSRGHAIRIVSQSRGFTSRVVVDGHPVGTLDEGAGVEVRMAPEHVPLASLEDRPFLSRYRSTFRA